MRRSVERRVVRPKGVLFAALITVSLVVALFQLASPARLAGEWPLGISRAEVDRFARWTTFPWERQPVAVASIWAFDAPADNGPCFAVPHARTCWLTIGDHRDSVLLEGHPIVPGGVLITFPPEKPYKGQHAVELLPVDADAIRAKYLEILADELGLPVPEITFVRVVACGDTLVRLKRERLDKRFLEKRLIADALVYRQAFHPWRVAELFPKLDGDSVLTAALRGPWGALQEVDDSVLVTRSRQLVDTGAAIPWLLMCWLDGRPDPLRERLHFAYRMESARIMPLYVPEPDPPARADGVARPWSVNPFTALLKDPGSRQALLDRREKLAEQRWRLRDRFAAADAAWLPLLANGVPLDIVQERAQRIQRELLDERLMGGDPLAVLERPMVPGAGMSTFLAGGDGSVEQAGSSDGGQALRARLARMKTVVAGDSIVFPRGRYVIDEDLVLPPGMRMVVFKGARFELGPGVNVLVRGGLSVQGTAINPVFVRAQRNDAPFGTFAVVGDGRSHVRIAGLRISGGSQGFVAGMYHSGMISIRGASITEVRGSIIHGSGGEDALNIKGGRVRVEDCEFFDGRADLLDIDAAEGVVRKCVFRSPSADGNGDGLDLSGVRMQVLNCVFQGLRDKGVSAGEGSTVLVRDSRFERNNMGLLAKDLSVVHVVGNLFQGNAVGVGAYRRKPVLGGGTVHLHGDNRFIDNGRDQEADEHSSIAPGIAMPTELSVMP